MAEIIHPLSKLLSTIADGVFDQNQNQNQLLEAVLELEQSSFNCDCSSVAALLCTLPPLTDDQRKSMKSATEVSNPFSSQLF